MQDLTTRRRLLIAGGLGLAASAGLARAATAGTHAQHGLGDTEKANIRLMKAFWADWGAADLDIDRLVAQYMAPNVQVRWTDDSPVLNGAQAAAASAKTGMPAGSRALITIHGLFAHGPMVAVNRVDVIKVPGQPDATFDTAGVAFLKEGRIIEYTDYVIR